MAAAIALATIVGNAVVDWFSQFCGRRTTLLLWASGMQTAAVVGVGVAGSFWLAVIFFLLVAAAMGVTGLSSKDAAVGKFIIAVVAQEASGPEKFSGRGTPHRAESFEF